MSDNGSKQVRGTGRLIKELNRSRILECFLSGGALSRVEVAERTGISLPAVSQLVAELEAEDMLVLVGKGESSGGRRPLLYEYNARHAYVVGLDMGGTKIAGGVADLEGNLIATARVSTHEDTDGDVGDVGEDGTKGAAAGQGPSALHRRVRDFILNLIDQAGIELSKVKGIGIGVPGIPDESGQDIRLAPGLHGRAEKLSPALSVKSSVTPSPELAVTGSMTAVMSGTDGDSEEQKSGSRNASPGGSKERGLEPQLNLASYLEGELRRPVFIDNDVNMIVRGELWKGALRGVRHGVCVTVGTGIGVGLLMNGEVYRGAHGAAGEIGYWLIGALGPVVRSEGYGPLETFAAGPGIARRYRERVRHGAGEGATARDVVQGVIAGDPVAGEVWQDTVNMLGVALANLASLIDPEAIVIGGGVVGAPAELFLEPLREMVCTLAPYPPRVVEWELGERAGIYGAVSMVAHAERSSISYLSPEVTV